MVRLTCSAVYCSGAVWDLLVQADMLGCLLCSCCLGPVVFRALSGKDVRWAAAMAGKLAAAMV